MKKGLPTRFKEQRPNEVKLNVSLHRKVARCLAFRRTHVPHLELVCPGLQVTNVSLYSVACMPYTYFADKRMRYERDMA